MTLRSHPERRPALAAALVLALLGFNLVAEEPAAPALPASPTPAASPTPKPLALPQELAVGKIVYENNGVVSVLNLTSGKTDTFDLPERMEQPVWHQDGKRFAYTSSFGASLLDIPGQMFMSVSTPGKPSAHPSWSGDGTRLVYETGDPPVIEVYDTRDKGRKTLPLALRAAQPAWHPTAERLAFVAAVASVDHVFVVDAPCLADGSCDKAGTKLTPQQITRDGRANRAPAWSPDGRLAIARDAGDGQGTGIFVLNADGSGLRRLSPAGSDDHAPSWGSNDALAFERGGAAPAIFVMKADGSAATSVVDAGRSPSWWQPRPPGGQTDAGP